MSHPTRSPFVTDDDDDYTMSTYVNNALLLATLPNLFIPRFLTQVIAGATTQTRNRLVIVFFSRHFNTRSEDSTLTCPDIQGLSHTKSWDPVQRLLTFTYVQATRVAWEANKIQMQVDVLLKGLNEDLDQDLGKDMDIVFRVSGDSIAVPLPESISFLRQSYLPAGERNPDEENTLSLTTSNFPPFYPVTVIGGTFDHLHAGHKILLSMAAYITSQKLIIGITDDNVLQKKANKHLLENFNVRAEQVKEFLKFFKPSIILDITPIVDVYGPTRYDPNIQALVVSKETIAGAEAITSHRQKHNLPPLEVFTIDVISSTHTSLDHKDDVWLKDNKLSSTFVRQWIVNHDKQK